jgi:hypothetical protein
MMGIDSQAISTTRRDELLSLGYDGVIGTHDGMPFEYVAFNPEQIEVVDVRYASQLDAIATTSPKP